MGPNSNPGSVDEAGERAAKRLKLDEPPQHATHKIVMVESKESTAEDPAAVTQVMEKNLDLLNKDFPKKKLPEPSLSGFPSDAATVGESLTVGTDVAGDTTRRSIEDPQKAQPSLETGKGYARDLPQGTAKVKAE
jgi:hypothetical protein